MAIVEQDVKSFFNEYGQALGSRDAKVIATYWGIPGLVMSDQGTIPVASTEEVEAAIRRNRGCPSKYRACERTIRECGRRGDRMAA